jgi:hypothetical protein
VAFNPDGGMIATGSEDSTLKSGRFNLGRIPLRAADLASIDEPLGVQVHLK